MADRRTMSTPGRAGERGVQDLFRLYLNDIGRFAMLTADEEVELAQCIANGKDASRALTANTVPPTERANTLRTARVGAVARDTFVQANLRLVVPIARRHQTSSLPLLDLVQEGNLGLIDAVEKFDWRPGFRFSTYATGRIHHAITRAVANIGRTIRLPIYAGDALVGVQRARARLEPSLGRLATTRELAAEADLSPSTVAEVLAFNSPPRSLSEPLTAGSEITLESSLEDNSEPSPFDAVMSQHLVSIVTSMLDELNDHERALISLRFGLDRFDPAATDKRAPRRARAQGAIGRIEARALSKLRRHPSYEDAIQLLLDS